MSQKIHLALNTSNFEKSVEFYQALFDVKPSKLKPGYAKFDLQSPPLNFTLNEVEEVKGNQINHLGIQVTTSRDVNKEKDRLEKLGLKTLFEEQTDCCYAIQDKVWVKDPDGHGWETFVVIKDSEIENESASCCKTAPSFAGCCS